MQDNEKRTVKVVAYTYMRKRSKILVYIIYILHIRALFLYFSNGRLQQRLSFRVLNRELRMYNQKSITLTRIQL